MLSDFQIIARLLVAFRAAEQYGGFESNFVDEGFIPASWEDKDRITSKMSDAELVEGYLSKTCTYPAITLKGTEYAVTNEAVRKEIARLRERAAELPAPLANAVISLSNEPAFEKCQ